MITHEQYLEYKKLVEEYEQEEEDELREAMNDGDDNSWRYDPDDDFDEFDSRMNCKCGAWTYGVKGFIKHADCICGAE